MSLNNTKQWRDPGFTIVELLVVIVVIGILAAITVASYTGVTNKAYTKSGIANGDSIGKVLDAYAAEFNYYPSGFAAISSSTYAKIPGGVTINATASDVNDKGVHFQYARCDGTATTSTGARLSYWSYEAPTGITYLYFGSASSGSTCTAA